MAEDAVYVAKMVLTFTEAIALIHSKMSFEVAKIIGRGLREYRNKNLVIQVTIGTTDAKLMSVLEPSAPRLKERMKSLQHLYGLGFNTSVSCTPALDTHVKDTYRMVFPYTRTRFHVGSIRRNKSRLENRALNAFSRAYGKWATPSEVHPKDRNARAILDDWLRGYGGRFDANWAEQMLRFEKRYRKVVCERDIYDLNYTWQLFVPPRYTLPDIL
jgi:DNA repair photolyase